MYGTITRLKLKPGVGQQLLALLEEFRRADATIPGFRTELVYRSDRDANEYFLAVAFDSEAAYRANAEHHPAQHARYLRLRELLTSDPEWHDGTIVYANP